MKYMGSKARIAHELLPIILKDRKPNQYYVEPFVGGANMIDKVDGLRIGSDINKYLISLYKELQNGWIPPRDVTREHYKDVKDNFDKYDLFYIGYVGIACSYNGIWFTGYAGEVQTKMGLRNYSHEAHKNISKQKEYLKNIDWYSGSYETLIYPENSIIYCDIPYIGTAKYTVTADEFNHNLFYIWVRKMELKGHQVFISEYSAPEDFSCVWEGTVKSSLSGSKKTSTEKLFTLNPRVKLPPKQPNLF
jgi:DNA adenine methylase